MSQSKYQAGLGGDILGQGILNLDDPYIVLYCMMYKIVIGGYSYHTLYDTSDGWEYIIVTYFGQVVSIIFW